MLILNFAQRSLISSPHKAGQVVPDSLTECAALRCRYIAVLDFFDLLRLQVPDAFYLTLRRTVSPKNPVPLLWLYL